MWVNYLVDFCFWIINTIQFVGGIFGIVVFYWCWRGNIKVKFFDWEDEPR